MAEIKIKIPDWLDEICVSPVLLYRRLKFGYTFRKIYLGEAEYTIVDSPDYYKFGKYKWILLGTGSNSYAVREAKIGLHKTKRIYLHREIMRPRKGKLVDHSNTVSLDNRRANLRFATHSQNVMNRKKTKSKTTSRYLGVYWDKYRDKWGVMIRWQSKGKRLRKISADSKMKSTPQELTTGQQLNTIRISRG